MTKWSKTISSTLEKPLRKLKFKGPSTPPFKYFSVFSAGIWNGKMKDCRFRKFFKGQQIGVSYLTEAAYIPPQIKISNSIYINKKNLFLLNW